MAKHLRAEQLEQFKDAFLANDVATHRRYQAHIDECEQCRTRIVETHDIEAHLRNAFVLADRSVTEDDIRRARAKWTQEASAVLLPVPPGSAPGPSTRVRPLPVRDGDVGFVSTSSERWPIARRIAVGFVALVVAMVFGLAIADGFHARTPSRTPVVLVPPRESRSIVQSRAPTRELPPSTPAMPLHNAVARSGTAEAGVVREHRRGGSDQMLHVNADVVRGVLQIQPPYEFVQRVATELPPPLRLDFYTCVADPEAQQHSCMQTLGRAQFLMARRVAHRMHALTDSADARAWQRIQDRLYLR